MSTLADRIREAFGTAKPAEIARATKKTKGAVTQWLDGTTKSLKGDTATRMEAATGYRAAWILTGVGPKKLVQTGETVFDQLTAAERSLLTNFRALPDEDQLELATEIANRATKSRAHVQRVLRQLGVRGSAIEAAAAAYEKALIQGDSAQQGVTTLHEESRQYGSDVTQRTSEEKAAHDGPQLQRVPGKGGRRSA